MYYAEWQVFGETHTARAATQADLRLLIFGKPNAPTGKVIIWHRP